MKGCAKMSRPLRAVALAAVAASVAFALPSSASAAATRAPRTTTNPAIAAAGWLAQQFSNAHNKRVPNGDHIELSFDAGTGPVFFFDGGTTIDAAMALAATRTGRAKTETAINYVANHLNAYVDYTGSQGGPFMGSVGKAAVGAIVAGRDPQHFGGHHLLTELKKDECPSGSTTCTPGSNSNVFSSVSTSFIAIAEARGARRFGAQFAPSKNLVNFLLGEQCPNGGFSSDIPPAPKCAPDADATGYAVMALQAIGGHRLQIAKAARYLVQTRRPNGAWVEQGGPNIDSTGLAAAALVIAGRSAATSRRWLASQQVRFGPTVGTGSARGALRFLGAFDPNSSIKGTADGIFGLVRGASLATLTAARARPGTSVLALLPPRLFRNPVRAGAHDRVLGRGFAAHERVQVIVHSAPVVVRTVRANGRGTVTIRFRVPPRLSHGTHRLTLRGVASGLTTTRRFVVRRP